MSRTILTNYDFASVSRIIGLPAATSGDQPATFAQLQAAIEGLAFKDDVRVFAPSNVNLSAPGGSLDGVALAIGDSFLAANQTTANQNGIYVYNGASTQATRRYDAQQFSDLRGAVVTVVEGSNANTSFRQTVASGTINVDPNTWTNFGSATPTASESVAGVAMIATQAMVNAGTDNTSIITPLKLANFSGLIQEAVAVIGDGSSLTYQISHNFNSRNVQVRVYRNSGNYDDVEVDIMRPSVNTVTIGFASAPAINAFAVMLLARPGA